MYHYEKENNPKLNTKSLFAYNKHGQVIVLHNKNNVTEVSLSKVDNLEFPAFDYKLIGDKLWSRSAITIDDFTDTFDLLHEIREHFPEPVRGFSGWQRRIRD